MFFVASILVSEDAMWAVTRMFEGYFVFGVAYPGIVSAVVAVVLLVFAAHALLALRKFPADYAQYRAFLSHRHDLRHTDTTLWWVQVVTGFALFFLATPHLYQMLTQPAAIGPYGSADRVWSGGWWPLYLLLLFAVELHGGIGLYRLAVKWGWFYGPTPDRTRRNLKRLKWGITAFFLVLGLVTLAAYMKLGYEHRDAAGERYVPSQRRDAGASP
jgi:fumarate reductase subunit C